MPVKSADDLLAQYRDEAQALIDALTPEIERIEQEKNELLAPLYAQREEYEGVIARLVGPAPKTARNHAVTARRPTGARPATAATRRASQGNRLAQLLDIAREKGSEGVTMSEAADIINARDPNDGVEANYLYRVRSNLEKQGKLRKVGTRSFIVTEEDQLAERTRELEAAAAK